MQIRHKIFELFIKDKRLRFSEIEKATGIKSNNLTYHLNQMMKEGVLEKDDEYYLLTTQGEGMIPFFAHITKKEAGVLPVVITAIIKNDQILLLKRKKKPYQNYWALPGGKLKMEESLEESAVREAKEETGLDCEFSHLASIVHERVKEDEKYKYAFILFLAVVNPKSEDIKESDEGRLEWFPLKTLQSDKIIPSDYYMIQNHLEGLTKLTSVVMEEKEEKVIKFEQA
jgi:8-oxo-dGTP diphosphatase